MLPFSKYGKLLFHRYERYLPTAFDDSLTLVEKINKVIEYLNRLLDEQNSIIDLLQEHDISIEQLKKDVRYMESELEKVRNGDYVSLYLNSIENWINNNLKELVASVAKFVWFGLNDDGYFIAVIPDNWKDINFDTTNEGHLVLEY